MRTSLNVEQQEQFNAGLGQLHATARTQLQLQSSVEGLSAVAVTYYAVGLCSYVVKALAAAAVLPVGVPPELALGLATPFIGAACVWSLHRLKHAVLGHRPHP